MKKALRREAVEEEVQEGRHVLIGGRGLPGGYGYVHGHPKEAVHEELQLYLGRAPRSQDQTESR